MKLRNEFDESRELIEKAFIRLGKESPFYSVILLHMVPKPDPKAGTIGLRISDLGRYELIYNPKRISRMELSKIKALVLHQILHIVNLHVLIKPKNREDKIMWDLAMDAAVNQFIPELDSFSVSLDMILSGQAVADGEFWFIGPPRNMYNQPAEFYHDYIEEWVKEKGWEKSEEFVKGREELEDHQRFGDFPLSTEMMEANVRSILKEAVSKSRGNIPGFISEKVREILSEAEINWKVALRRFVGSSVLGGRYRTRMKPNRRYDHEPGWRREYMAKLAIIVDTSGSIIEEEFVKFFTELDQMVRMMDTSIWLVEVDEMVQNVIKYSPGMWKDVPIVGRGGTDLQPGVDYAESELRVEGTVIFTDGYTEVPYAKRRIIFVLSRKHNEEFREKAREIYGPASVAILRE